MKVINLSKVVIGGIALALSTSLWASTNANTAPLQTSNQQQINKFKKDSYAATRPTVRREIKRSDVKKMRPTETPVTTKKRIDNNNQ